MTEPRGGPNAYLAQISEQLRQLREAQDQFRLERLREMERLRGIKYMDLPLISATGANPFGISADSGIDLVTPQSGYVWFLRYMTIEGLTSGATPDVINVLRRGRVFWQLNGNQFAQTWGRGEKWLFQGETLSFASVGTFNSTVKIIISMGVEQVPAEEIGKLR
jgi:hypothetical protein